MNDYDDYKINIPSTGNLNIEVYNIPLGQYKIDVLDNTPQSIYSINTNGKNHMNVTVPNLNAGQYFIELSGIANNNSWWYPYAFKLSFQSTSDVQEFSNQISNVISYPNPFHNKTTIAFTLMEENNISTNVYNSIGQLVSSVLTNEKMDVGKHDIEFDGSGLPSGIYYYTIQSDNIFLSNKMVIEK